ncbi:HAD-IIB family hydrolase [Candidatus Parcubacteria bacterium]|nr:MAG: HAD-IIB family hydrolase [Candidatus Parcubacteria bacterium]
MLDIDLVSLVQLIGYPGLVAIILAESGLFFAFFLPGASLLFTAGILAVFGIFNIWVLVPLVIIAAIIGDSVGYWFGAKVGVRFFTRPDSRFFKQKYVDQTRAFFDRYGKPTIVLARFVPIVRTFAPILAGVGAMNYRTFLFYNVLGALLWAGGVTLLGYFLGSAIPDAEKYITPIALGIIALTVVPLFFHWWKKKKIVRVLACPRAVIFDIDDTLTESFKPPKPEMLAKLVSLLDVMPVAIMSAAGFPRVEKEFLPELSKSPNLKNLYIFPNSTAECYVWNGSIWDRVYDNELSEEERARIKNAITESVRETGILNDVFPKGPQMIDRGAQIAFAALGLDASDEAKKTWDVDKTKRDALKKTIAGKIPGFEILIGGRTTIDITKKGINKSHGVGWLSKHLALEPREMLYVGDALYRGGNDSVVIPTGVKTVSTSGPEETLDIIDELLNVCAKD